MSTSKRSRAPADRPPAARYHHGDLRRALVAAALQLVRLRGLDGFTLRETARRVGVSQAAPYRHFATKEALLAAVAEEGFRSLHSELERTAVHANPRERLRAQGLVCFRFYVADPARFRVMFGRATAQRNRYPGLAAAWQGVNERLVESLVAAQHAGEIRDGDPMELGLATGAMVHGFAALVIDGHVGTDEAVVMELFDRIRAVLYRGLHPDAPTSRKRRAKQ